MQLIKLNRGYVAIVDDEDFDRVNQHRWRVAVAGPRRYARRNIVGSDGKKHDVQMHRFVLGNNSSHTDHINGDGLDNRKENLRACNATENQWNRRLQKHSSRFKGVSFFKSRGKWHARIKALGKIVHLGFFDCEVMAARAYDSAARSFFGEFAKTNQHLGVL